MVDPTPGFTRVALTRTSDEWLTLLERANVPAGPVLDFPGMFDHSQVRHRGMHIAPNQAGGRHLPHVANPIKFSATPIRHERAPPLLGEHTDEVLRGVLGLESAEIDALRASGAI